MTRAAAGLLICIVPWLLTCCPVRAQNLSAAGVLGNSGEQGKTLVRFAPDPAYGLGVVFDRYGTMWDRAGSGQLNRYTLDGRLVASYRIPPGSSPGDRQTLTPAGIVLFIGGQLYRMALDSPPGSQPTALGITATRMSFAAGNGDLGLLQKSTIVLLDGKSLVPRIAIQTVNPGDVGDLAVLDDGSIVIVKGATARLFRNGREITDGWPKTIQIMHLQHAGNFWYGEGYHGTVHRFDQNLNQAPGVVLGGGTGAFIGHVEGDEELSVGNGIAIIGDMTAGVSGKFGIVYLLDWDQRGNRYAIARRLGAAQRCAGLALKDDGTVWFNWGRWSWNDIPTSPIRDSIPNGGYVGQPVMLKDGTFLAAMQRDTNFLIFHGDFTWKLQTANGISLPSRMLNAAAVYRRSDGVNILMLADASGQAMGFPLDGNGSPGSTAVKVGLEFSVPVHQLTTLATKSDSVLLAATDGSIVEMTPGGDAWRETIRWNRWGPAKTDAFGSQVYITTDSNHLWVSDTERHRVLCFDLNSKKLLGAFGQADQAGNDLAHLSRPTALAARDTRAVIFDSDNQRVVKLVLGKSQ